MVAMLRVKYRLATNGYFRGFLARSGVPWPWGPPLVPRSPPGPDICHSSSRGPPTGASLGPPSLDAYGNVQLQQRPNGGVVCSAASFATLSHLTKFHTAAAEAAALHAPDTAATAVGSITNNSRRNSRSCNNSNSGRSPKCPLNLIHRAEEGDILRGVAVGLPCPLHVQKNMH